MNSMNNNSDDMPVNASSSDTEPLAPTGQPPVPVSIITSSTSASTSSSHHKSTPYLDKLNDQLLLKILVLAFQVMPLANRLKLCEVCHLWQDVLMENAKLLVEYRLLDGPDDTQQSLEDYVYNHACPEDMKLLARYRFYRSLQGAALAAQMHWLYHYVDKGNGEMVQEMYCLSNIELSQCVLPWKGSAAYPPLVIAIEHGNNDIVKLLIKYGATPRKFGRRAILKAAVESRNVETVKLLMRAGFEFDDGDLDI